APAPELVGAGCPSLPEAGVAHPLCDLDPPCRPDDPRREPQGPTRALGLRDLRRQADRPGVRRRLRRGRAREPVARRPHLPPARALPPAFIVSKPPADHGEVPAVETPELLFENGIGGFTPDGLEYRMLISCSPRPDIRRNGKADRQNLPRPVLPPAPWVNVVA